VYIQTYGYFGCYQKNEAIKYNNKKRDKYKFFLLLMNVVIENVPTCVKALSDAMNCDSGAMNCDSVAMNCDSGAMNCDSQHGVDFMLASEMDYTDNYTVKSLKHIAAYYGFKSMSRIKKNDIIQFILQFENDDLNIELVQQRKNMWFYMSELKDDHYLHQFIIDMD